jgi:hypothetical protein
MSIGSDIPQETPESEEIIHSVLICPACESAHMFMAGRYDEYRKIPSATRHDEYEMEWVMVEEWQCSGCGFTECIDL